MKYPRIIFLVTMAVVLCIRTGMVLAQDEKKDADKPVIVSEILKKAECPLTEEQTKTLEGLDFSEGPETFKTLFGLFDKKQDAALKEVLGIMPGWNDGPETPLFLFQVVVFEKVKCPLMEKQLKELKALPMERGAWEKMIEIFTDEQNAEMKKLFGNRE